MKSFLVQPVEPDGTGLGKIRSHAENPEEATRRVIRLNLCCAPYGFDGTLRALVFEGGEEPTIYRMYAPNIRH